jgi:hypothetical protein
MSARKEANRSSMVTTVLQIVVAAFLFTLGLIGVMHWNSDLAQFGRGLNKLFGRSSNPVALIIAIVELAAGVVVLAGVFVQGKNPALFAATLAVGAFWAVLIVVNYVAQNFLEPEFFAWLNKVALDCLVLISIWIVARKFA